MDEGFVAPIVSGIAGFICAFVFSGPVYFALSKYFDFPKQEAVQNVGFKVFLNFSVFIVTAFSLWTVLGNITVLNVLQGQFIAFIIWLGFIFTSSSIDVIWKEKPIKLWVFESVSSCITIQVLCFVLLLLSGR
ncbi:hypothetical protein CH370_02000 [Leptospira kmetyi]|uniref:DUF1761 family protein n=1 Tax=Leptospira kmetyi TaxID=408139 RepID=UPI000C2B1D24|nr:DUF1761 family protein [Leptospira kmetyi]PJZ43223.1 hypothetical protein CH370_02000 [Leptospira kmetyi]TGL68181.1 DUF1761 family protein [Leptospira kmetyi]